MQIKLVALGRGWLFIRRRVIVHQYLMGGSDEVVELATRRCPPQHHHNAEDGSDTQRNEQVKGFHGYASALVSGIFDWGATAIGRCNRAALTTTSSELADMPSAASHGEIHPIIANGTTIAL